MSEKDEDYRRRELALQEIHSRELAKKSQESAEDMMTARTGEEEGTKPQGGGGSGAAESGARERKSSKVRDCRLVQQMPGSVELLRNRECRCHWVGLGVKSLTSMMQMEL